MRKHLLVTLAAVLLTPVAGCVVSQDGASAPAQSTSQAQPATGTTQDTAEGTEMGVSRVRFATGEAEIVIRVADNPTSRDFVSKLPLTLSFEEFAGREKISYLPERLTTDGSPGSAPRNGDLIYYVPWGNLGFYYNADPRSGVSDDVIAIGTVESSLDQLNRLERGQVTVEVIK